MKISESPERLTLRDQPGCIWGLGVFFLLIGALFVLGPLVLFSDRAEQPWYVTGLSVLLGSAGVAAGVWVLRVPLTTTTFDRLERVVTVRTWGLRRMRDRRWPFTEVAGVRVIESQDSEGDPVYRLQLELRQEEPISLTEVHLHFRDGYEQAAQQVRRFLGLP
jgi:hypothetical protein